MLIPHKFSNNEKIITHDKYFFVSHLDCQLSEEPIYSSIGLFLIFKYLLGGTSVLNQDEITGNRFTLLSGKKGKKSNNNFKNVNSFKPLDFRQPRIDPWVMGNKWG